MSSKIDNSDRTPTDRIKAILSRIGLYERLRASWVYDAYWNFADKRIVTDRREELSFYQNLLEGFSKGDIIFDVGANHGYKTDIFLKLGATVIAAEPDEYNQEILKKKFLRFRLKKKRLIIIGKAVSSTSSIQSMWIDSPGSAMNTLSSKWVDALRENEDRFGHRMSFGEMKQVETVSIEQLISKYGTPFFVKIDVEGHELSVLQGLRRPISYLSFEVNLPEFRSEGLECVRLLQNIAADGRFNYSPDCRRGLALDRWLNAEAFAVVLDSCADSCVEIFWKNAPGKNTRAN